MKQILSKSFRKATTLEHILPELMLIFESVKLKRNIKKIGYVSGVISSQGDNKISENKKLLADHTEKIRQSVDFPVFSAADIFTDELYLRIDEIKLSRLEREQ